MKRREFVEQLGIGSAILAAAASAEAAQMDHASHHRPLSGPLASATVSFGAWPVGTVDAPVDRMETLLAPVAPNVHALLPYTVTIKEGGSVNYVLAGFHQIAVYINTKPDDIDTSVLLPIPGAPPVVGLIDDEKNRIYRGLDRSSSTRIHLRLLRTRSRRIASRSSASRNGERISLSARSTCTLPMECSAGCECSASTLPALGFGLSTLGRTVTTLAKAQSPEP